MTEHTYESWVETYFPVRNHADHGFESCLFETYGDDLAFVNSCDKLHVWTLVETDTGGEVIMEGCRFVNRLAYFVTVRPWSETVEVTL
jgi:hypothetical protein